MKATINTTEIVCPECDTSESVVLRVRTYVNAADDFRIECTKCGRGTGSPRANKVAGAIDLFKTNDA